MSFSDLPKVTQLVSSRDRFQIQAFLTPTPRAFQDPGFCNILKGKGVLTEPGGGNGVKEQSLSPRQMG